MDRPDARSEVIQLLRMRYFLTERVYYHHSKVVAGAMISKAVELALDAGVLKESDLLALNDWTLLDRLARSGAAPSAALIARLQRRDLLKRGYVVSAQTVGAEERTALVRRYHESRRERGSAEAALAAALGRSIRRGDRLLPGADGHEGGARPRTTARGRPSQRSQRPGLRRDQRPREALREPVAALRLRAGGGRGSRGGGERRAVRLSKRIQHAPRLPRRVARSTLSVPRSLPRRATSAVLGGWRGTRNGQRGTLTRRQRRVRSPRRPQPRDRRPTSSRAARSGSPRCAARTPARGRRSWPGVSLEPDRDADHLCRAEGAGARSRDVAVRLHLRVVGKLVDGVDDETMKSPPARRTLAATRRAAAWRRPRRGARRSRRRCPCARAWSRSARRWRRPECRAPRRGRPSSDPPGASTSAIHSPSAHW